jgi:hypothetical protein
MEVSGQLHSPAALPTVIHWIGGWVGPRAGLNAVEKRKIVVMLSLCVFMSCRSSSSAENRCLLTLRTIICQ